MWRAFLDYIGYANIPYIKRAIYPTMFSSSSNTTMTTDTYEMFRDYLGLSRLNLDRAVSAGSNRFHPRGELHATGEDGLHIINVVCDVFSTFDPLELIRFDAKEDFLNNGVEAELDEWDLYQSQLREQTAADCITRESTSDPLLQEYLALKEKKKHMKKAKKVCVFCKNNGEPIAVYSCHVLRDDVGIISCPILRHYICPLCGYSGDLAHTIKYCPTNNGESTGLALLKTSRLRRGGCEVPSGKTRAFRMTH